MSMLVNVIILIYAFTNNFKRKINPYSFLWGTQIYHSIENNYSKKGDKKNLQKNEWIVENKKV